MSIKSERKKAIKAEKQEQKATDGYLVRKKYPQSDSDEWFYFADELEFGYLWTPDSAIGTEKAASVFVFSTQQAAQRKAREIEKYHEWRRKQGNASGADVSVVRLSEAFPNARLSEVPNAVVAPQPAA